VNLTDSDDRVRSIIEAMESIEADYENLRGVLPKRSSPRTIIWSFSCSLVSTHKRQVFCQDHYFSPVSCCLSRRKNSSKLTGVMPGSRMTSGTASPARWACGARFRPESYGEAVRKALWEAFLAPGARRSGGQYGDSVFFQMNIVGHKREPFDFGLRHQHPVKRISMIVGQAFDGMRVLSGDA